jgi:hypothetical protein
MVGVGPLLVLPTASKDALGSGKWQGGAAAVVVRPLSGGSIVGGLATWQTDFAGDEERPDTNLLTSQVFAIFQIGGGYYVRSTGLSTFDFENVRRPLSDPAGRDELALDCEPHQLGRRGDRECRHGLVLVKGHGTGADAESRRSLLHRVPLREQPDHLPLARAQAPQRARHVRRGGRRGKGTTDEGGRQPPLAPQDAPEGPNELAAACAPEHVARGPGAEGLGRDVGVLLGGQEHDPSAGQEAVEATRCRESTEPWQRQVGQYECGLEPQGLLHEAHPVGDAAHHLEVGPQEARKRLCDQRLRIGQEDARSHGLPAGAFG